MTQLANDNAHFDSATPFLIDDTNMRGVLVRLDYALNTILQKHDYPEPVSRLLGELIVLVAMLGEMLKFEGIITAQIKGSGSLGFLVADYAMGGKIRGYASIDEAHYKHVPDDLNDDELFKALLGSGYLAITIDHGEDMERYQGIVPLEGGSITELAAHYFSQSEQLETDFNIQIGQQLKDGEMQWCAGGMMVQQLPNPNSDIIEVDMADNWERIRLFLKTVHVDELIDPLLSPQQLLYRLFHEDGVWVYEQRHLEHRCRCSRKRTETIIRGMPKEDKAAMLVDGKITVTCQFCNNEEVFTVDEI